MERSTDLLNYQYSESTNPSAASRPVLVLVHGLMGDMNNLGMIGRHFTDRFNVLKVDLVNHGASFYRDVMDYHQMAADIIAVLDHLGLKNFIAIGHSMGGKVAMRLAFNYPQRCTGISILDMAPVQYGQRGHDVIFRALEEVAAKGLTEREAVRELLSARIDNPGVVLFLMKSFDPTIPHRFVFNVPVLVAEYDHIGIWEPSIFNKPASFIYGGASPYVSQAGLEAIAQQFPHSQAIAVPGATHWLHAEQPKVILAHIEEYFTSLGLL